MHKDKYTFWSARWRRGYNPDLCFVTSDINHTPLHSSRRVLQNFPHSQHRPVLIEIGTKIPLINTVHKPRWNFNKAKWIPFTKELDANVRWIPPIAMNYNRLVSTIISTAKKHIPRGFRKEYIPGWNQESNQLYKEFLESGDNNIATELLESLDNSRAEKWKRTTENIDFTHASTKAWCLLRKLGGSNSIVETKPKINANLIANRIVDVSRVTPDKHHTRKIKKAFKTLRATSHPSTELSRPFSSSELEAAIKKMKNGKAAGVDGIYPEFLKNCGPNTKSWLTRFFSNILETGYLPHTFKCTKTVALLKPGKPSDKAESYRPIALLSVCYKVLERMIYNRIEPSINQHIPIEQAGFRSGRSCTDQILALTTFIESGFQKKLKTSAVFVDLTAAYDTVWREGLVYKLLKVIKCTKLSSLINNMLSNRIFRVSLNDDHSKARKLSNGLPQGSVLAPLLFNLYISDLPETASRKFGYADDLSLATQNQQMSTTEVTLTADLALLSQYFKNWRLCPSMAKTESACFHLNNHLARSRLNVQFNGITLNHNTHPKYLGVTLDRTLSFNKHLSNTAEKLKSRNNLLHKLAGTTWGADAPALRRAALGIVYSTAEYAAPVWLNSAHVAKVDSQLNIAMRTITGAIRSTPTQWLSTLSNIAPPVLRRQNALVNEYKKIAANSELPVHGDLPTSSVTRLSSRKPPLKLAKNLLESSYEVATAWSNLWQNSPLYNSACITDPTREVAGFHERRKTWVRLNRIRTNHGRSRSNLFKYGAAASPECDCGAPSQTINHILSECPLRSYPGDIADVYKATANGIEWLENLDVNL